RDNHDGILAMSCHELRTVAKRSVDNLAETRFGVLKFPIDNCVRIPCVRIGPIDRSSDLGLNRSSRCLIASGNAQLRRYRQFEEIAAQKAASRKTVPRDFPPRPYRD